MRARTRHTPSGSPTEGARWAPEVRAGEPWGAKIDLSNCYWRVHLPRAMVGAVRVAVAGTTYALVHVPFGWHRALGRVQHLIGVVLSQLPNTQVVVQYLDDVSGRP